MRDFQIFAFVLLTLGLSTPAHAYLDPGTGSILLQGLIAAIASVGFYAKTHWEAIKAYSRKDTGVEDDALSEEPLEELKD